MKTSAFILMLLVQVTFTFFTVYFFWKVLTMPSKHEPDSFLENDDIPEEERAKE